MPRGQNEAFKASQGRFATNKDEARKAGRKGGKAKTKRHLPDRSAW